MLAFDDPSVTSSSEAVKLIARTLSRKLYKQAAIVDALEGAGLSPDDYRLEVEAKYIWAGVVPDAIRQGKLAALIDYVSKDDPAFRAELERQLLAQRAARRRWYEHDDPYTSGFVGLRADRAVIDRAGLREGLELLADEQYSVLLITGAERSGKTHSWLLVQHLRDAKKLPGLHRFVKVSTHDWTGDVTGVDLADSLNNRLDLGINLISSDELQDAMVRKFLDSIVGRYPQDDIIRWIVLDGLDRPSVQDSARDLGKGLVKLVDDGQLPQTRLIVTGLDPFSLQDGSNVTKEAIPPIDEDLVRAFLSGVAEQLGRTATDAELRRCLAELFPGQTPQRDLTELEREVVRLVKESWAQHAPAGAPDDD